MSKQMMCTLTGGKKCHATEDQTLNMGLNYYNEDRPHSSLNDETPDEVYYQSRINERAA